MSTYYVSWKIITTTATFSSANGREITPKTLNVKID